MAISKNIIMFAKFVVSGTSAVIVEYLVFTIMDKLITGDSIQFFQSVSFLCGAVVSFSLNKHWVFVSNGSTKSEALRYFSLVLINLVISNFILWVVISQFHLANWVAKLITMVIIATWNFLILQRLVFPNKETAKD